MKVTSPGTGPCTPRSSTELTPRASTGASVRGIGGFGRSSAIHPNRLLHLTGGPPVAMVIVDETTRVRQFLGDATELCQAGLVTGEDVTVICPPDRNRSG